MEEDIKTIRITAIKVGKNIIIKVNIKEINKIIKVNTKVTKNSNNRIVLLHPNNLIIIKCSNSQNL